MIDSDIVIFVALCLVILLLLHLLFNDKTTEGFQITNDVPQENKVETNYLKKIVKQVLGIDACPTGPKCGSNRFQKWCNNQKLKKSKK